MSKPSETLQGIRDDLDVLLRKVEVGTSDYPRSLPRVEVAFQRAQDRAGAGQLPASGIRGGSSNPDDRDERKVEDRVKRQAEKDAWDLSVISARMAADARELKRITDRQAETIHESKLPLDVLPGCRSCARKEDDNGVTIGGQWAPVDDKGTASAEGLCRACYEFKLATGGIPPVKWCHKRHAESGKAANRWLATAFPKLLESVQRKQKAKGGLTAEDLLLRPEDLLASPTT